MTAVTTHRAVPSFAPFVCSIIGGDAGEPLDHIIVRKEAERDAGIGEFWWGLSAPLGSDVEAQAQQNGGTLPALFSKSDALPKGSSQVRIWEEWESVLDPSRDGRIPGHIIVTSGHKPKREKKREPAHYALVCQSNVKLALGRLGYCDLTQARTADFLPSAHWRGFSCHHGYVFRVEFFNDFSRARACGCAQGGSRSKARTRSSDFMSCCLLSADTNLLKQPQVLKGL
jgi:hypothetical protein